MFTMISHLGNKNCVSLHILSQSRHFFYQILRQSKLKTQEKIVIETCNFCGRIQYVNVDRSQRLTYFLLCFLASHKTTNHIKS